jgi:crotonobetaine/carnitine-CoA ligase
MLASFPNREECVLADILERQATDRAGETYALFADGSAWSFAEAAERAWRFGNALLRDGVQPGASVAVWGPSSPELLQAWFGACAAGAVYVPLNPAARGAFLQHGLKVATPRVLVVHPGLMDRLAGLDVPTLELIVSLGDPPEIDLPWRTVSLASFLADAPATRPVLEKPREPWHDHMVIFTSGTTGPSKGVRLPYASQRLYADGFVWPEIGAEDRSLLAVPLFHVAGTSTVLAMLQRGGSLVLVPGFSAARFWDDVRRFGATTTAVLHGMVTVLMAQPETERDADNPLRIVYMGPLTRVDEFAHRYGVSVYTCFGMSEVPVPLRSGLNPTKEQTCGREYHPGYELRIVDEHDLPVPLGTPGELIVRHRHPWMMNGGYKDMPAATAEAWRNGWFHTGDQMLVDADGDYIFLDRTKDAIRRRGENVSSYEVETEILAHPDIDQAAAVAVEAPGVDASAHDQEVKVVVVPVQGRSVEPLELVEWLIPRMTRHMVPRYVEVVADLPRTPTAKVMKAELRARGVTPATWDRVAAGIELKRETLT